MHKVLNAPGEGGVWENVGVCKRGWVWTLKITRDVAHIILIFYYAYKILNLAFCCDV